MSTQLLPQFITKHYEVHEFRHACAILKADFPNEWKDIIALLSSFRLKQSWITQPGGRKSKVSESIDSYLYQRGWAEQQFTTQITLDSISDDHSKKKPIQIEHYQSYSNPTHKIDCFKNRVALEIEWNNKDPFFDRDLNNFRLLFDLRAISVGVIITRSDELQQIFNGLGKGSSYGASTTHMSKLLPRIQGGSGAGCPILVFGITPALYQKEE